MARYLIPLFFFGVVVVFLYSGLDRDPRAVPSPLVGKPAPDFRLATVREPDKSLGRADLLGQVSLLNVWASWCVACRQEHPFLLELARNKTIPIYGLNYKDKREDAIRWLGQLGDPYTASAWDLKGRVGLDLGVYGVPETFVIDTKGNVAYKHIGPLGPEVWQSEVLPIIEGLAQSKQTRTDG